MIRCSTNYWCMLGQQNSMFSKQQEHWRCTEWFVMWKLALWLQPQHLSTVDKTIGPVRLSKDGAKLHQFLCTIRFLLQNMSTMIPWIQHVFMPVPDLLRESVTIFINKNVCITLIGIHSSLLMLFWNISWIHNWDFWSTKVQL